MVTAMASTVPVVYVYGTSTWATWQMVSPTSLSVGPEEFEDPEAIVKITGERQVVSRVSSLLLAADASRVALRARDCCGLGGACLHVLLDLLIALYRLHQSVDI